MENEDTDIAARAASEMQAGLRAALDPDPDRAGQKYALLRRKLVSFFEWNGATSPDACADETLLAAAWKLTDGASGQSVPAACLAIARTVLTKHRPGQDDRPVASDAAAESTEPDRAEDMERILHAFETSLDALPADSRELVLTYYAGGPAQSVDARHALARRLDLPVNQLRIRAHRTRSQIEQAVTGLITPSSREPA
jgi:DNA-directed RNA polymerase specialized sigma24 family protein